MTIRLDPDVHEHIQAQPEGPRGYAERVVRADREATATGEEGQSVPVPRAAERAEEAG